MLRKAIVLILALSSVCSAQIVGPHRKIFTAASLYHACIDFRTTAGYVTDPTQCTYSNGTETSVTTRTTGSGASVTMQWIDNMTGQTRDRQTTYPQIAGVIFWDASGIKRFAWSSVPSGSYKFRIAWGGDPSGGGGTCNSGCTITFKDGTTTIFTLTHPGSVAAGHILDATSTDRTSLSDWVTNNALSGAFSITSGTLNIVLNGPSTSGSIQLSTVEIIQQ